METHEAQNGEGTCPASPTVFLVELGLKFMSPKSTVEAGEREGKRQGILALANSLLDPT